MPWTVLAEGSEILAVHAALLSTGKILIFPGDQHRGSATDFQHARLFNPTTNLIEPCDAPTTDVFCSGHAFLGDGRIVVAGGTARYGAAGHAHAGGVDPFSGERSTWLFEPRAGVAGRWVRVGDLNFRPGAMDGGGRWYPTLVTLGNGEVMAFSGHPHESDPRHNNDIPERFSHASGVWSLNTTTVHTGSISGTGFYPRVHLLRDGRVFIAMHIAGSTKRLYEPYADQLVGPDIADTGINAYDDLWNGPSVLLPLLPADDYRPRVLMAGLQPKIIDLGASSPAWIDTVARVAGIPNRTYASAVILPTGQILICGGVSNVGADTGVHQPEIYEPGIDWVAAAYSPVGGPGQQPAWNAPADSAQVTRNYHSVALLMPDGRVWTAGSSKRGAPGNPDLASIAEKRIEIYSPPYVGQPRPTIAASPAYVNYGAEFELQTPQAASIQRVAFIRCGSATHAFDSDQRYIALTFSRVGATDRLRVTTPPHGNIAPPGQYMLWIIDSSGRPCERAPILRLAQTSSFILSDRSSFSVHEVDALLSAPGATAAEFPDALYFVVQGHLPHEIASIGGSPSLTLHFDTVGGPLVPAAQMMVAPRGGAMWEDPAQPADRPQRVTFAFDIRFGSNAAFAGIDHRVVWVEAAWGLHRAAARLDLTRQPNPYMLDGAVEWLSTDLRVFKIRRGEAKFGITFQSGDTPFAFLQRLQAHFNSPAGAAQFRAIPETQAQSPVTMFPTEGGTPVYNFAFAKVRYRALTAQAPNVAVFFRLFNSVGTALEFDTGTTYARHETAGGGAIALLGRQGSSLISIPFFGTPRVTPGGDMRSQTDPVNVHDLQPAGANEFQWHYGAYLDINQESERHISPTAAGSGPFGADAQSVKALIRDEHQCLVAEVYFKSSDPAAPPLIADRATPGSSDKLSQRNLAFVRCANPGAVSTRTVHHTFELKPSDGVPAQIAMVEGQASPAFAAALLFDRGAPDELVVTWGNLPRDAVAEIFLPSVAADDILAILAMRPGPAMLEKVDQHTVRCRIGDIGYIPIPQGTVNHAGLLSIELPAGVQHGQEFVVRLQQASGWTRRIIGAFELRIQVRHGNLLLDGERRRLSLLRWIQLQMPVSDRWRPVYDRYLGLIARRVDDLGGDASAVAPSPYEDGSPEQFRRSALCCWSLAVFAAVAIALLAVLPLTAIMPVFAAAVVIGAALWLWQGLSCRLSICGRLRGLLFGMTIGTAVSAVSVWLGFANADVVLTLAAVATGLVSLAVVVRSCFGICVEGCDGAKK